MRDSEKEKALSNIGGVLSMPRDEKVRIEEKTELVIKCIKGEMGVCEAGRVAQVDHSTIRCWIARYKAEGEEGLKRQGRNRSYTAAEKLKAVLTYMSGKGSLLEICKENRIRSTVQLRNWIKVYNAHGDFDSRKGSGGGSYMKQGRNTTQEERIQIAKECLESGKKYGEMALKYKVSYQQARTWTLRFEELGEAGLEDRRGKRKKDQTPRTELEAAQIEIEQLKHKLYLAEMERDLLKKLDEIVRGDVSDK
jgi:transposase-like protein